jgi:hypothetical protein
VVSNEQSICNSDLESVSALSQVFTILNSTYSHSNTTYSCRV